MNKIFCFLLIYIITLSCNIYNKKEFYTGYVYDFDTEKPLQNVKVIELESNHETTTNEKGYFSMKKLENVSSSLIFEKKVIRKILFVLFRYKMVNNNKKFSKEK